VRILVTDPDEFFSEAAVRGSILGPVSVVGLAALVNAAASNMLSYWLYSLAPESARDVFLFASIIGSIGGVLSVFASWFIYAGIMHLLAVYFDGEGSLRETALLSGWGFIPDIVTGAFQVYLLSVVAEDALGGVELRASNAATVRTAFESHPALTVAPVVTVVGLLWSGLLWSFAIKHVHDLDFGLALRIAAVPTALGIALTAVFAL